MTAATGRELPAANGPTDRTRGAVSTVDPASSPTSEGVGEGRGPCNCLEDVPGPCNCLDPAVSRTLAVAEQTVEKARERR